MEFKYKARFTATATISDTVKGKIETISKASLSSLEDLKKLLPDNEEMKSNPDLLYAVFNICVANLANANGDCVDTETALAMAPYFKNKSLNIEHETKAIVGVITNSGFSSFGENKMITAEELKGTNAPFNIALSAVIWPYVDPLFASYLVDSNDPNSYSYKDCATSWEVGFNSYDVMLGSKNVGDAEIISDPEKVMELSKCFRDCGGNGFTEDGREVYRLIKNGLPLAGGFTSNPAAAVSGVSIITPNELEEMVEEMVEEELEDMLEESDAKLAASAKDIIEGIKKAGESATLASIKIAELEGKIKNLQENEKKISHSTKIVVKTINKFMKFNTIDELCDAVAEASAKGEGISPKELRDCLNAEITKISADFKLQLDKEKAEKDASELSLANANEILKDFEALKTELANIKATAEQKAKQDAFDVRMASLDEKYTLDAKARKVLAKQIMGLDETSYASWLEEDGQVILAGKEKNFKEEEKVEDPTEALKKVKASTQFIPNSGNTKEEKEEKNKPFTITVKGSHYTIG